jgi:hypothetical protein
MKINPTCPVFRVLARAAGINISKIEKEDEEDEKTSPRYQTFDASGIYSPPKESWAQQCISRM